MATNLRRALRNSSWMPRTDDEGSMWLTWLVRLRWVAIIAQIITLSFAFALLDRPTLVLPFLGVVIASLTLANGYAIQVLATQEEIVSEEQLLGQLIIDVIALTGFFVLAGGPNNPFTALYLVHVAMGAVMLAPRRAGALSLIVLICYGILFLFNLPLHYDRHSLTQFRLLQLGQFAAFTITLVSITTFIVGLARSLRSRKRLLLESQNRTSRIDRLRSVGTLAAGAAHELNTPLSTIGLRLRRVGRRYDDEDTNRDVQVMREQLDRCSRIVNQLLVGAGDPTAAGLERRPLGDLIREGVGLWSKGCTLRVQIQDEAPDLMVELPTIAFVQALINLLENARQAQEEVNSFDPLQIRVLRNGDNGVVEVRDHGVGLPGTSEQVGEPFFTTKDHGTGLGVFVARQVADGAGGGLHYASATPGGTIATWWFPEARRRKS